MSKLTLRDFVTESNRIEGIVREPTKKEVQAHREFLVSPQVSVPHLLTLLRHLQPDARIRNITGLNVRVGDHVPPPGGPEVHTALVDLLMEWGEYTPYELHQRYEHLHPFTDGNGRSGRALWVWHKQKIGQDPFALPFLHRWYYDSLTHNRPTVGEG